MGIYRLTRDAFPNLADGLEGAPVPYICGRVKRVPGLFLTVGLSDRLAADVTGSGTTQTPLSIIVSSTEIDDAIQAPPAGTLLVGNEQIIYTARVFNGLQFVQLTRGANGTPIELHEVGAVVFLLGSFTFSVGTWTLQTFLAGLTVPSDRLVLFNPDTVRRLPTAGRVQVNRERISYTSKDDVRGELLGLTRGADSTAVSAHEEGDAVHQVLDSLVVAFGDNPGLHRTRAITQLYLDNKAIPMIPEVGGAIHQDAGAGVFTDRTGEARSAGGSAFILLADTNDFFYVGMSTPFNRLTFDIATASVGMPALEWRYWNGTAWTVIPGTITDGTTRFAQDGIVRFIAPVVDWTTRELSGRRDLYWIRVSIAAGGGNPTTVPTCFQITPPTVFTLTLDDTSQDANRSFVTTTFDLTSLLFPSTTTAPSSPPRLFESASLTAEAPSRPAVTPRSARPPVIREMATPPMARPRIRFYASTTSGQETPGPDSLGAAANAATFAVVPTIGPPVPPQPQIFEYPVPQLGQVTADIEGLQDDATGTITGTPTQLLTRPAWITHLLLREAWQETAAGLIHTASFAATHAKQVAAGLEWGLLYAGQPFLDWRRTAALQGRAEVFYEAAQWYYLWRERRAPTYTFTTRTTLHPSAPREAMAVFGFTGATDITTRLVVEYGVGQFLRTLSLTSTRAVERYGLQEARRLELPWIDSEVVARSLGLHWLYQWDLPRMTVSLLTGLDAIGILLADTVQVEDPVLTAVGQAQMTFEIVGRRWLINQEHLEFEGLEADPPGIVLSGRYHIRRAAAAIVLSGRYRIKRSTSLALSGRYTIGIPATGGHSPGIFRYRELEIGPQRRALAGPYPGATADTPTIPLTGSFKYRLPAGGPRGGAPCIALTLRT